MTLCFMFHRFPVRVGQEIEAKVVDFNGQDHKISLSMKALEDMAPKHDEMATSIGDMIPDEVAEEVPQE